jgi:hypothetical protein
MLKEMTANQLVAYNLRRAREERGWTQELAAQHLEQYLGKRWSKASFSIAERSADDGARKREFDANELLAFSRTFEKPVAWFFTPRDDDLEYVTCGNPLDVQRRIGYNELLAAALPHGIDYRKTLATLRSVLIELEMADAAASREAKEEEEDGEPTSTS